MGACGQANPEEYAVSEPAPPPALALTSSRDQSLDQVLTQIIGELDNALTAEGLGRDNVVRAEALSDRLLETQIPFAWLSADRYGVEPKLRQIQALSDRVLAEMRSGVRPDVIRKDIQDLRKMATDLRQAMEAGGTAAPPTLDRLMAAFRRDSIRPLEVGGE